MAPHGWLRGAVAWLPAGDTLTVDGWHRRHRSIVGLLWAHVVLLPVYGIAIGRPAGHVVLENAVPLVACALLASSRRCSASLRAVLATLGLTLSSVALVHLSGGLIEMHFHFFVVVAVVSLYQSWRPFLVALAVVLLHHGIMGTLDPSGVYNHPAAVASPWVWALVHTGFILAESAACLVAWRLNEDALERERHAQRSLSRQATTISLRHSGSPASAAGDGTSPPTR